MDGQIEVEIVIFMTFSSKIWFISHKLNLKNVLYMRAYDLSFIFIDMIELMGNNGHDYHEWYVGDFSLNVKPR